MASFRLSLGSCPRTTIPLKVGYFLPDQGADPQALSLPALSLSKDRRIEDSSTQSPVKKSPFQCKGFLERDIRGSIRFLGVPPPHLLRAQGGHTTYISGPPGFSSIEVIMEKDLMIATIMSTITQSLEPTISISGQKIVMAMTPQQKRITFLLDYVEMLTATAILMSVMQYG